jgi:hypothetical protein
MVLKRSVKMVLFCGEKGKSILLETLLSKESSTKYKT